MTTFRCAFGDCSDPFGTPLLEQIATVSAFWGYVYAGFLFVSIVGFFNVISAIFVESSLASAANLQSQRKRMRLEDQDIWSKNIMVLLVSLNNELESDGEEWLAARGARGFSPRQIDNLLCRHFPRSVLDKVIAEDEAVAQALEDLGIDEQDYKKLSDILDPDNSGDISVMELVDGLKRLRDGDARRSDIIRVDLMIRSLQDKMEDMLTMFQEPVRPPFADVGFLSG